METNKSMSFLMSDVDNDFDERLNDLDSKLSQEEETLLKEILEEEKKIGEPKDFMQDLLDAVKKGAEDYLDAMTDTGETFNQAKNSKDVTQWNETEIQRKNKPATIEAAEAMRSRTMSDAGKSPFDADSAQSTLGMSEVGRAKFERAKEAYKQRTKSITNISTKENTIHYKTDPNANYESLSGLRGYRVGKVVPLYTIQEMQDAYNAENLNHPIDNTSNWIRTKNFEKFDTALMKEYGFTSPKEAKQWRENNHLTIHEGPDGMMLIPTDVHDAASHMGYCSKMSDFLKGEITQEDMNTFADEERLKYIKHEATQHGIRVAKGIGFTIVKDAMRSTIAIVCRESYQEFSHTCEEKFWLRMKRILENCWLKLKNKWEKIFSNIWQNLKGSILNEFLTMINDYLFGVFKNIFKVVRQMWGSIKNAFKVIVNKTVTWQERIFEASKILSAGVVAILGFSLNELIEKGLASLGIPFASFIAECLSGLFAGIMSAIVLMIFDNMKAQYIKNQAESNIALANAKLTNIGLMQIQLNSLKMDKEMIATFNFSNLTLQEMAICRANILQHLEKGLWLTSDLQAEWRAQNERTNRFKQLNDIQNEQF